MTDEPLIVRQLREPISDETRKVSRELLVSAAIGLVVVYAGLVPTRIGALGIELSTSNQAFFRYAIAGVVLYLTATFLINVSAELIAWGTLFQQLKVEEIVNQINAAENDFASARARLTAVHARLEVANAATATAGPDPSLEPAALSRLLLDARELQNATNHLQALQDDRLLLVRALMTGNPALLSPSMRTVRIVFEAVVPLLVAGASVWSLFWVK